MQRNQLTRNGLHSQRHFTFTLRNLAHCGHCFCSPAVMQQQPLPASAKMCWLPLALTRPQSANMCTLLNVLHSASRSCTCNVLMMVNGRHIVYLGWLCRHCFTQGGADNINHFLQVAHLAFLVLYVPKNWCAGKCSSIAVAVLLGYLNGLCIQFWIGV